MKQIFTTCAAALFALVTYGQHYDHVAYKQDFDHVYCMVLDSSQYRAALKEWERVANKYPSVMSEEVFLKTICYKRLGQTNKAARTARLAWILKLQDPNYLRLLPIAELVDSWTPKQHKTIDDGMAFSEERMRSLDFDSLTRLFDRLDSVTAILKEYGPEVKSSNDTLAAFLVRTNERWMLAEFARIYDKYGFPGEFVDRGFSERPAQFLPLLAQYEVFYNTMLPRFEKDVHDGNMPASLFLKWKDAHSIARNQQPEFAMYANPRKYSASDIQAIKDKRFAYGLSRNFPVPFSSDLLFLY